MNIRDASFGKLEYCEKEGTETFTHHFSLVCEREYFSYLTSLSKQGYIKEDEYELHNSSVSVFRKDNDMILANYFRETNEAIIVTEKNSGYFSFSDTRRNKCTTPFLAQLDLEDFGTSVVIRLEDGKFIIFDGGWNFTADADKLVRFLYKNSPYEKPIIAAWIITHPHIDHYGCFLSVFENYPDALTIERMIYNFTDTNESDLERIPELKGCADEVRQVEAYARKTGALIYKAHTGQIYTLSGAHLEILSSPDNTLTVPVTDLNSLSLIIKVTVADQTILLCADADLSKSAIAKRYGSYLKSDILQPPHHMFYGGDVECYNLINPSVCIVPSFEEDVYGVVSPYLNSCKKENRHLFYNLSVKEFFTGSTGNVVLPLPYTPTPFGRENYLNKLYSYKRSLGAESWFFADMSKEECDFTFVNATNESAKVFVDLIFEDISNFVYAICLEIPSKRTTHVNILDKAKANADYLYYNPHSLSKKGIKEGATFAVHIRSNIPIVVKGHKPADYYA